MTQIDLITDYSLRKTLVMMKMYSGHTSETDSIQDFQSQQTTICAKQNVLIFIVKRLLYTHDNGPFIIEQFCLVSRIVILEYIIFLHKTSFF